MTRRLLIASVITAVVAVAVLLVLDIAYLMRGSLEEFPTEEQHDKVRLVTTALAVPLAILEGILLIGLRGLLRPRIAP